MRSWRDRFVAAVWATHNNSPQIQGALDRCLEQLGKGARSLNVGAGSTNLHPAMINVDITPGPTIHVCALAESLPFQDKVFDFVLSQEVLEHVSDPFQAMCEMGRVLRQGGSLYCQVPFIIGFHPGPSDFWRFTREGIQGVVEQAGLKCREVTMAVGPATGFYRILVEFLATLVACLGAFLYLPAKGTFALILFPLKWLDPILRRGPQADRIAGGYLVIATRP